MNYNQNDYRFTTSKDGKALFVYALGMPPENTSISIKHVFENQESGMVKKVSVIGREVDLPWSVVSEELQIMTPVKTEMDSIVTVFKVEFI